MADNFTERENYILSNSVNIGWFLEAIDKNNPLHPEEGAAHTESYELDGQNILVPRVRIKDGKAILNKENALEEALERGDYIVVPEGEDPDQYSKDLSKLIGKFRGFDRGGLAVQTERAMETVGPQSELERQRSKNIAEQMATLPKKKNEYKPSVDPQKEEIIKKYNLDSARSGWQVGPTAFHTIYKNLPTNFRLLTEFILGKDTPITMADFTKDELVSIIALSENQEKNKLNLKNRKLKGQPENVTTVTSYGLKPTHRYPDWVESNPYFRAMAHSLFSPEYQVRTTLGRYDTEETPSSLIVKDVYDMNIGQRSLPKLGNRKDLAEVLDYMRIDPEMAGEFIANVFRPNPQDSRKINLVIPKRKKVENFKEGGLSAQTEEVFNTDAEGRRRRQDRPEPEQKPVHPLETVPFFQRPKGSSVDDIQVGEDDAGNPVFQGRLGTYIVRLNPDQRTTRQKITEAIPTIKESVSEYLEDPKLPTKEQMGQFARAATIGAIEDLGETMFTPKGTLGDVFSLASGAGAASVPFDVPKGALRIFGGVGAEGAAKDKNLKKAIKLLKKSNVDPTNVQDSYFTNKKIWEQTGWYVDPKDGQWRFEIDDSKSNLKDFKSVFKTNKNPTDPADDPNLSSSFFEELGKVPLKRENGKYKKLNEVLEHEEFFRKYPDLKDVDVIFYSDPSQPNLLGSAGDDTISVNLSAFKNYKDIKSTLIHEIQHIVQYEEGFVRGASAKFIPNVLTEKKSKEIQTKIAPLKKEEEKLDIKLNAAVNQRKIMREQFANKPLKNLSESDQIEIYKLKPYNEEKMDYEGPSWASIARDYGVPVVEVREAYGRYRLLRHLDKEVNRYNLALNKISSDLYKLEQESFDIETNFYRGAGGEIEARLAQYRRNLSAKEREKSFPIDSRTTMLQQEGGKFEYTGKEGVDPYQYKVQPRREPEKEKGFLSGIKKKLGFAEGGTVMNRQMEMAFMKEGGLKDDGMNVDPVSGNEVPPGSMAKEVRDDIPARLSEGEYVVPADVVQYYGVKFFEDLRADAKIGLQEMESNGRIGGEPVDDDLSDDEMMEIQTMMQGGMVQPQQQSDPYLQQNMMYQQPQGMAVGGLSQEQVTTPGPLPSVPRYTGEFSWEKPVSATTAPVDTETPSIENCAKKGQDYDPITKTCVPRTEVQPVQDTGGDDRPPAAEPDPNAWMEKYDYTKPDILIKQTRDNITKSQLPGILSIGAFGALDAGARAAQTAANIVLLQAQGVDTAELVDVWNANKPNYLPNFAINGDQLARQASIAHGIELDRDAKDIFGKDIFTDNSYSRYKRDYDAKGHKPKEKIPAPSVSSKNQISQNGNNQDKQPTAIQKATIAKAQDKSSDYGFDPSVKKSKAPATAKKSYVKSTYKPTGKYAEDEKFGALNKGGLMKKKKK